MQILVVDIGTSMQDILLLDSERGAVKINIPSPTALVARAIQAATRRGDDLYLTGVTMGGGPCMWAVRNHLSAGYQVYATPDVAHTFADDLDKVKAIGIAIIPESDYPPWTVRLELRDFDLSAIERAFMAFGIRVTLDALALAVFDHRAAPPGVSESAYRFAYLSNHIRARPSPIALAYTRADIPTDMLRMRAVAASAPPTVPLTVMDPAFAALLGGQQDPRIRERDSAVMLHLGNMHTLAVHVRHGQIAGLFEHHTNMLSPSKLDDLLVGLVSRTVTSESILNDRGHGALILDPTPASVKFLAVTGPRHNLACEMRHRPYFAEPYGDLAASGCWGLIRACAMLHPEIAPQIDAALESLENKGY